MRTLVKGTVWQDRNERQRGFDVSPLFVCYSTELDLPFAPQPGLDLLFDEEESNGGVIRIRVFHATYRVNTDTFEITCYDSYADELLQGGSIERLAELLELEGFTLERAALDRHLFVRRLEQNVQRELAEKKARAVERRKLAENTNLKANRRKPKRREIPPFVMNADGELVSTDGLGSVELRRLVGGFVDVEADDDEDE